MLRSFAAGLLVVAIALGAWSSLGGPMLSGWGFGALVLAGILWMVDGWLGARQDIDVPSIGDTGTASGDCGTTRGGCDADSGADPS